MKEACKPKIIIITLTLLVIALSATSHSGTLYRCVNSQGSVILTDNVPTDPDFKCTFSSSNKDRTPYEKQQEERNEMKQKSMEKQRAIGRVIELEYMEKQKEKEQKKVCLNDCQYAASSCSIDCHRHYIKDLGRLNDCLLRCLRSKNTCISNCQR